MIPADINHLKFLAKNSRYSPHGEPSQANCIIGFSFGTSVNSQSSNHQLAQFIKHTCPNLPLIIQSEIAESATFTNKMTVISESRAKGQYLDSKEIAEQAYAIMKANSWKAAILVAHPCMLTRNDYLCTAVGINTVLAAGLESIPFDANSSQPWTRDTKSWWLRESTVIDYCNNQGWFEKPK